ncbi:MAG TPA: hypothetical protein VG821_04330 [Rhizomicrobium sp.]|nr:hypothetical protein [Rhizomicrobium sp.]
MRQAPLIVLALTALLAGCGGPRQQPAWMRPTEKPRDENYHGGSAAALLKYDANKDGTLTRAELIAGLKAEFAAHDTHRDGCLDAEQTAAINQSRVDADQSTATPIVDWNQDGCIDYTEFSAAPYSLFDQMDRDRDGKITPEEFGKKPDADKSDAAKPDDAGHPPAEPGEGGRHRRGGEGGPSPGNGQ